MTQNFKWKELEPKNKKQDVDVFMSSAFFFFGKTCVEVHQCKICLNILTWPGQRSDGYLRPVSSLAPSCWASPPWLSLPFSLFFLHSRFPRLHRPPLRSHCLLHRCQSHLPHWHKRELRISAVLSHQVAVQTPSPRAGGEKKKKKDELTCWVVFGFGELVVRLLAATKIETGQSLEQLEWGESRKASVLCSQTSTRQTRASICFPWTDLFLTHCENLLAVTDLAQILVEMSVSSYNLVTIHQLAYWAPWTWHRCRFRRGGNGVCEQNQMTSAVETPHGQHAN